MSPSYGRRKKHKGTGKFSRALSLDIQQCVTGRLASLIRRKWQQGEMPGPLDGGRQHALVLGAGAGAAAGIDGATARHILLQHADILVIDALCLVRAKLTDTAATTTATGAAATTKIGTASPAGVATGTIVSTI